MIRKQVLKTAGKTRRARYERFAVREAGAAATDLDGTLVACESANCALGDRLAAGMGLTAMKRANGEGYGIDHTFPEADAYFTLPTLTEDGYEEKLGYLSLAGGVFLDDGKAPLSRYAFNARAGHALVYDENEAPKMAFAGEKGVYVYSEATGMVATEIEKAGTAVCFFGERLFCAVPPFTVAYSAPLAAADFAESIAGGGRIALPDRGGEIVALTAFGGYVYAFFERGICRLQAAGDAREFSVSVVEYGGGRIFGDSVGVCSVGGEKAFFLAGDGLYVFDGRKAERICENLAIKPVLADQVCGHAEVDGKYFLRYTDSLFGQSGLIVDAASLTGYRSFAAKGLSVCFGKAVCYAENGFRAFDEVGSLPATAKYSFLAEGLRFGVAGMKTLKRLRFFGTGGATVYVCGGGRTRKTVVSFDGEASAYIGVRGEAFSIRMELKRGTRIDAIEAEVESLQGGSV